MANIATTTYKVTGTRKAVNDLWTTLQQMEVDSKDVMLYKLAEHYGIDYQKERIGVRGHIYWAEYEEDEDMCLLSFETETAWDACNGLFYEINKKLGDELSISYRCCESGCNIYYVHDEGNYFPEECCITSSEELFGGAYEEICHISDAIKIWCDKTGIEQGERTDEEMIDFINNYKYEEDNVYFDIHKFDFVW